MAPPENGEDGSTQITPTFFSVCASAADQLVGKCAFPRPRRTRDAHKVGLARVRIYPCQRGRNFWLLIFHQSDQAGQGSLVSRYQTVCKFFGSRRSHRFLAFWINLLVERPFTKVRAMALPP